MTPSRALVTGVVSLALAAYSGQIVLLFSRPARNRIWNLLRVNASCCLVIRAGWLWLVLVEKPEWYDTIPAGGWLILAAQLMESVAMTMLSFRVVRS